VGTYWEPRENEKKSSSPPPPILKRKKGKAPWVHTWAFPLATWNLSFQKSSSPFLAWANSPCKRTPYLVTCCYKHPFSSQVLGTVKPNGGGGHSQNKGPKGGQGCNQVWPCILGMFPPPMSLPHHRAWGDSYHALEHTFRLKGKGGKGSYMYHSLRVGVIFKYSGSCIWGARSYTLIAPTPSIRARSYTLIVPTPSTRSLSLLRRRCNICPLF